MDRSLLVLLLQLFQLCQLLFILPGQVQAHGEVMHDQRLCCYDASFPLFVFY
jgi:hypothetical protein